MTVPERCIRDDRFANATIKKGVGLNIQSPSSSQEIVSGDKALGHQGRLYYAVAVVTQGPVFGQIPLDARQPGCGSRTRYCPPYGN